MDKVADTFVLVHNNEIISPPLITIRSYAYWFENTFDKYTSQLELYLKAKKTGDESVLEWHPGTKIGKWFDKNSFNIEKLKSWYILRESVVMDRLVKLKLAEYKDAVPLALNDDEGRQMLRVYTVEQIELYIRNNIDPAFDISKYINTPKQIRIKDSDFGKIIMPKVDKRKRRLF